MASAQRKRESPGADRRAEKKMESLVGLLLRGGVLSAAVVVLLGGILYLTRHGTELPAYHVFKGEPNEFRSVPGIVEQAWSLGGRGLIQLGCLLLVATPVLRVAVSLAAFALLRDRIYVIVTAIVLATLLFSLFGSGL